MTGSRVVPNVFIVGAPKCGTTALHTYLGQHPEIFMAKEKTEGVESNHFATDLIPVTDPYRSDEKYFWMFENAGDKRIVGESSVFYMLSKAAAQNIYRFNPESKIIIMLRNPVDMLQSYHAQLVYNQDEDIADFEAALKAETKRKNGRLKIRDGLRFNERLFYSEVVSYTEQVQRYLSLFGKEQVHIIIYDDFEKDTASVYHNTLEYLSVNSDYRIEFPIINARKIICSSYGKRISLGMSERLSGLLNGMGKIVPNPLRKHLIRVLEDSKPVHHLASSMNPKTRRRLQKDYRAEIKELSILLERDLNYWCEDDR